MQFLRTAAAYDWAMSLIFSILYVIRPDLMPESHKKKGVHFLPYSNPIFGRYGSFALHCLCDFTHERVEAASEIRFKLRYDERGIQGALECMVYAMQSLLLPYISKNIALFSKNTSLKILLLLEETNRDQFWSSLVTFLYDKKAQKEWIKSWFIGEEFYKQLQAHKWDIKELMESFDSKEYIGVKEEENKPKRVQTQIRRGYDPEEVEETDE